MTTAAWWTAWVLDPTVCAVLIAALIAGKTLQRNGIRLRGWAKAAGAIAAVATYTMNTWESWAGGVPSQIVLHSIPVVVVFVAVEVLTELRGLFADAVAAAHARAERRAAELTEPAAEITVDQPVQERSLDVQEWSVQWPTEPIISPTPAPGRHIAEISDRSADVLAYVANHPDGVRAADVEAALELHDARRYLARLAKAGRLRRAGRGLYAPVPSVPAVPTVQLATGQRDTRGDTTLVWSANGSSHHNEEAT